MVSELSRAGADVTETEDGMIIRGGRPLHGAAFETYHDHRIAMSMAVCALACSGDSEILDENVEDGMIIRGGRPLHGAAFETYHDHRIAMSMAVCALACSGDSEILDENVVAISYPDFFDALHRLGG